MLDLVRLFFGSREPLDRRRYVSRWAASTRHPAPHGYFYHVSQIGSDTVLSRLSSSYIAFVGLEVGLMWVGDRLPLYVSGSSRRR
jgi:hypothetical protein